jgi:hypothetical protein
MHVKFCKVPDPQHMLSGSTLLSLAGMPSSQSLLSKSISHVQLRPFQEALHQVEMNSSFSEFLKYTVPQNCHGTVHILYHMAVIYVNIWLSLRFKLLGEGLFPTWLFINCPSSPPFCENTFKKKENIQTFQTAKENSF